MPPDIAVNFRKEAKIKDEKLEKDKASAIKKFFVSTYFFFEYVWNYKYISFMLFYVFYVKLPVMVFI